MFTSGIYQAKSWDRARYVVAKVEHLGDKPNSRFVVTTLDDVPARLVYERAYCGRGEAENRIKDFKNALKGDRVSCTTYVPNASRLLLHAFAYRLLEGLRTHLATVAPELGRAQFDTIRLRLLKVAAAHVRQSVRGIVVALPRAFGLTNVFTQLAARLGAHPSRPEPPRGAPSPECCSHVCRRRDGSGARARRQLPPRLRAPDNSNADRQVDIGHVMRHDDARAPSRCLRE